MSEYNEWFDSKYPNATCFRCEKKVDGESVVYCGGGGGECETWYCADCYEDGTDDCPVCKAMEEDCSEDCYCAKINGERDYCECSKCKEEEEECSDSCDCVEPASVMAI